MEKTDNEAGTFIQLSCIHHLALMQCLVDISYLQCFMLTHQSLDGMQVVAQVLWVQYCFLLSHPALQFFHIVVKLMNLPCCLQILKDTGQTIILTTSNSDQLIQRELDLSDLYLFSGPYATVELIPQPAECIIPPASLIVLLQPSAKLLYWGQSAATQTGNFWNQNLQLLLKDL